MRPLAVRSATSCSRVVAQAKSSSVRLSAASGSRQWASKPAGDDDEVGPEGGRAPAGCVVEGVAELDAAVPGASGTLTMLPTPVSDSAPGAGIKRHLVGRCDRGCVGSDQTIAWVPLPWWTSQSTMATRLDAMGALGVARRDGGVVEEAEAHRDGRPRVVAGRTHGAEGVRHAPPSPRPPPCTLRRSRASRR